MCGCITLKHPGGQGINSLESWPMNKTDRLSSPKSALFQLAQYILMNPLTRVRSSKGRDQMIMRDDHDGHVASVARTDPQESALL